MYKTDQYLSNKIIIKYMIYIFFISRIFAFSFSGAMQRVYSLCSIFFSVIAVISFLTYSRMKLNTRRNSAIIAILIYAFLCFMITCIKGGSIYALIAQVYPIVGTACLVDVEMNKHPNELIKAYAIYVCFVLTANFLDALLFKNISLVWGRVATSQYMIGPMNQFGIRFSASFAILYLYKYISKEKMVDLLIILALVSSMLMTFIVRSATTYICFAWILFSIVLPFGRRIIGWLRPTIIAIVYCAIWIILVFFNILYYFQNIIIEILHRDITLSGRVEIWQIAVRKLSGNWFLGFGKQSQGNIIYVGDKSVLSSYLSTHNEVLQIMYEGGIVTILALLMAFIVCTKGKGSVARGIIMAGVMGVFICWLTEAPGIYNMFFLLILCTQHDKFEKIRVEGAERKNNRVT